jgi:cytochrome P450
LYEKVPPVERPLAQVVRRGLVVVIGEEHRRQRKALNLAFGPAQIQALTGVFLDKANEVRPYTTLA